jgi:uncharacterized protein
MTQNTASDPTADMRKLPVWAFVVLAIVYLTILQGLVRVLTPDLAVGYARFTSVAEIWRALLMPFAVSVLFVVAVVTALGWWRPVLRDHRPVRRWVWVVPIIMGVAVLGGINYPELAGKGVGFTLLLLLGALLVGCSEEGMYRGIGVTTFRVNGYSEGKVALWSSVAFGLSHAHQSLQRGKDRVSPGPGRRCRRLSALSDSPPGRRADASGDGARIAGLRPLHQPPG